MSSKVSKSVIGRKFTGKTENFTDNRERHFYQRMLRAYLKGAKYFFFGRDNANNPARFEVSQEFIYGL